MNLNRLPFINLFHPVTHPLQHSNSFSPVFSKIEIIVHHKPNNFFVWDHLYQFHFANVCVFVMVDELIIQFSCIAFNVFRSLSGTVLALNSSSGVWSVNRMVVKSDVVIFNICSYLILKITVIDF